MSTLKIAFAGLRHFHITSLYKRLKDDPRFEIAAICEEDEAAAETALRSWGIKADYRNFQRMLDEVSFDILAIGDYYGIRGERAIAAMRAGKHILSDKPLCTSLDELETICALSASGNLRVGVMLDFRSVPAVRAAGKLIASGAIGRIHSINFGGQHPLNYGVRPGWYFEPGKHGGTLNDILIHGLDAVEYLTGSRIAGFNAARSWNAFAVSEPDFRDSAQSMFMLENGCGCTADVSYAAPDKFGFNTPFYWRFTLWGSGGVAEFCAADSAVRFYDNASGEVRSIDAAGTECSDFLEIFLNEIGGRIEACGTAHVLRVSRRALECQRMADMAGRQ